MQHPIEIKITIPADEAARMGLAGLLAVRSEPTHESDWVTVAEAARMLGCSTKNVYRLVKAGTLRSKHIGPKALRVSRESLT